MKTRLVLVAAFLLTVVLAAVVIPLGGGKTTPVAPVVPVIVTSARAAQAERGEVFLARWESLDGVLVEFTAPRRAVEPTATWLARASEELEAAKAERPAWSRPTLALEPTPPATPCLSFLWRDEDGVLVHVRLPVRARARPEAVALEAWTVGAELEQVFEPPVSAGAEGLR
jgi:hypothetical protein